MRNVGSKEKMEFAFLMAKHSNATLDQCQRLLRYGRTLGAIAEAHCNYADCPYNAHDYDGTGHDCPKQEKIQDKVTELCAQFGAKNADTFTSHVRIRPRDIFTIQYGADHDQFMFTCKGCSEKIAATQAFGQQPHSCKGKTIYIKQTSLYGVRL